MRTGAKVGGQKVRSDSFLCYSLQDMAVYQAYQYRIHTRGFYFFYNWVNKNYNSVYIFIVELSFAANLYQKLKTIQNGTNSKNLNSYSSQ